MSDERKSGELDIVLGLLTETRTDVKSILQQQAGMNATLQNHVTRLGDADRRIGDLDSRMSRIEGKCKIRHDEPSTDYPPQVIPQARRAAQAEATTRKITKFDPGLWVKIGMLIGAVLAGYVTARGISP